MKMFHRAMHEVATFTGLSISIAQVVPFWGDEVLLNGGGAQRLHSIPIERGYAKGKHFLHLPNAEYILAELVTPPRCLTCSGILMEFERATKAMLSLCEPTHHGKPLLCSVSIDCLQFGALCDHYSIGHTEPFSAMVIDEPFSQGTQGTFGKTDPPDGWLRAWPSSSLLLARRDHLLGHMWVPMYWRLSNYDAATQIIDWIRTKLGSLPSHAKLADEAMARLWAVKLPPRHGEWQIKAMMSIGPVGRLSDHNCLCRQVWQKCTGGFAGQFQSCQAVDGCHSIDKRCETHAACQGRDEDTCSPEPDVKTTVPNPRWEFSSIDSELAAILWFHMIWDDAEFPTAHKVGTKLSARGRAKRRTLIAFLRILCEAFPHDSRESTEESENLMSGASALVLNQAKIEASQHGDTLPVMSGAAELILHRAKMEARKKQQPSEEARQKTQVHRDSRNAEEYTLRCRRSFCHLYRLLRDKWKLLIVPVPGRRAVRVNGAYIEKNWHFCGHSWAVWSTQKWHECRGSFAGTRQLPCGIWTMLHSVFGHANDAAGGALLATAAELINAKVHHRPPHQISVTPKELVATIRDFIKDFMACNACRINFLKAPYDEGSILTHRDAVLWLWRAHNYVNGMVHRLPFEEKAFAEDPAFPTKPNWPPPYMCPDCLRQQRTAAQQAVHEAAMSFFRLAMSSDNGAYVPSFEMASCAHGKCPKIAQEWDMVAVFVFLSNFYGARSVPRGPIWSRPDANSIGPNKVSMVEESVKPMQSAVAATQARPSWSVAACGVLVVIGTIFVIHGCSWPRGRRVIHACYDTAVNARRMQFFRGVSSEIVNSGQDVAIEETTRLMATDWSEQS